MSVRRGCKARVGVARLLQILVRVPQVARHLHDHRRHEEERGVLGVADDRVLLGQSLVVKRWDTLTFVGRPEPAAEAAASFQDAQAALWGAQEQT